MLSGLGMRFELRFGGSGAVVVKGFMNDWFEPEATNAAPYLNCGDAP